MSVYVDAAIWPLGRMKMCHMLADSREELVAMAERIGLPLSVEIQKYGTAEEHYDICKAKRALAVAAGAIEVDRKRFVEIIRSRRTPSSPTPEERNA